MKHIIVAITPDEDGVSCGTCKLYGGDGCALWLDHNEWWKQRGPACLAAERKLAALIEAGAVMKHKSWPPDVDAWDRAVKEVKEERK